MNFIDRLIEKNIQATRLEGDGGSLETFVKNLLSIKRPEEARDDEERERIITTRRNIIVEFLGNNSRNGRSKESE